MKNKIKLLFLLPALLIVGFLRSQTLPNMGTVAGFGILAGSQFSASDTVTVKGNLGCVSGSLNLVKATKMLIMSMTHLK